MERYEFGEFTLDAAERRLSRAGEPIPLPPKTCDVLLTLVRNAGRLVSKRDLLDEVWPGCFVEENILAVHISALRKALREPAWIETAPRVGYRFAKTAAPAEVLKRYERGRAWLEAASITDAPKAVESFQSAIELDPHTFRRMPASRWRGCSRRSFTSPRTPPHTTAPRPPRSRRWRWTPPPPTRRPRSARCCS